MEMCQETYEVPAESCCHLEFGKYGTFGLHIKKAISQPSRRRYKYKTLPTFDLDDITGGGEADQPWSVDDVRYLLTSLMIDPKAKLHCNKAMHEMIEDRDCKLFERKAVTSGCCCPLGDVAHGKQCFPVSGASKERVIRQQHWIEKHKVYDVGGLESEFKYWAEDVPHDNIKDQDANMPSELVHADPKENELPEFAVNGKKWTWMKVEDQYASKCLEEIQPKPYLAKTERWDADFDTWFGVTQKYGAASCPKVEYTGICPPGEGLYIKKGIPDGQCLWSNENINTEEMQLKWKPQYPSECPRGYTSGENDWPGVEALRCQCSSRTINLGDRNATICRSD